MSREKGQAIAERETRAKTPRRYKVILHNDDYTTTEFVVRVLMEFFRHSPAKATQIMLQVHHHGIGVAGVYTREVAETKIAEVSQAAREEAMPLMLSMEAE